MVVRRTVNAAVAGSSPAPGANVIVGFCLDGRRRGSVKPVPMR